MVRLNTQISERPRATMRTVKIKTASVVNLMPPPVDAGQAPININTMEISLVAGCSAA